MLAEKNEFQDLVRTVNKSAKEHYNKVNGVRPEYWDENKQPTSEGIREALVRGVTDYSEGDVERVNVEIFERCKELCDGQEKSSELFEKLLKDDILNELSQEKFYQLHPELQRDTEERTYTEGQEPVR